MMLSLSYHPYFDWLDDQQIAERNRANREHRRRLIARLVPHYVKTRVPIQPPRPRGVRMTRSGLRR